ncbi:helix-turn-helix domain-containing protein [Pedosphaera parvula]|uniref:Uncharacterized protein n=1 Tax=Pedosphaera parvula (strain Ellin514) TaxID=320771 RepID=B9XMR2_PEDPL|nr:helix-turn-helix domain-containing protein [Pedosphaera parvula]EEF58837.1 hypothetical protein Cflav_PD1670 [Pedosphaera parvula Ellin514]
MAWKTVTPMEEMIRFVMLARSARFTVTELCEQFGISRKTGYKHLARYAADGLQGLAQRSHRPLQFPQRTDLAVEALVLAERRLHQTWEPKKLHKVLELNHGIESPPAPSTIGEILRRHGLSVKRRRKAGLYVALNEGLTVPTHPNHVWTVDFNFFRDFGRIGIIKLAVFVTPVRPEDGTFYDRSAALNTWAKRLGEILNAYHLAGLEAVYSPSSPWPTVPVPINGSPGLGMETSSRS